MRPTTQELFVHMFCRQNYSNYFKLLCLLVERMKLILLFYVCLVKLFHCQRGNPRLFVGWRSKPQNMRIDVNILRKQFEGVPQKLGFWLVGNVA
jgi:hypothetical protein